MIWTDYILEEKGGARGFASNADCMDAAIQEHREYKKKSKD